MVLTSAKSRRKLRSSALMVLAVIVISLISVLAHVPAARADSTLVQQNGTAFGAGIASMLPVSFLEDVSSGDIVVVAVSLLGNTVTGVTDSLGSTYSLANSATGTEGNTYVYYATLDSSGSDTVTVAANNEVEQGSVWIFEVFGATAAGVESATGQTGSSSGTGTQTFQTSTSVGESGAFLLAVVGTIELLPSPAAGTGFTLSPVEGLQESGIVEYSTSGANYPSDFPGTYASSSNIGWDEVGIALQPSTSSSSSSSSSTSSTSSTSTSSSTSTTSTSTSSTSSTTVLPPPPDTVVALTISPSSGALVTGAGGFRSAALIAQVAGIDFEIGTPSATVVGNPPGISVSFSPASYFAAPPSGLYSMGITVTSAVPTGVYTVIVDYSLTPDGGNCFGVCVQPSYLLSVNPQGLANLVTVSLQDGLNVQDKNAPSAAAALSDMVNVPDSYAAPAVATLSDVAGIADKYVAPATAVLSDGVNMVDRYISPVNAALGDIVGLIGVGTASPPPLVHVLDLTIEAHSPVNIVVSTQSGEAGFEADGTVVNQLLANLTGPNTEPETITILEPSAGYYQIIVFGKTSADVNGSAYTITVASDGGNGTSLSEWSYTGVAAPGSTAVLSVYLLSNGNVQSSPPSQPTDNNALYAILVVGVAGALVVVLISRRSPRTETPSG